MIACRAYELFLARGAQHGRDLDDWLQAERELLDAARSWRSLTSEAIDATQWLEEAERRRAAGAPVKRSE